jgi:hypothetical protein
MTEAQVELAKRAVWCRGWRWMPGMLAWRPDCPPVRLAAIEDAGNALQEYRWLPDLTDPATVGCLLALVRAAWGDSEMHMALGAKGWVWLTGESRAYDVVIPINAGETEDEALVAALEAAP